MTVSTPEVWGGLCEGTVTCLWHLSSPRSCSGLDSIAKLSYAYISISSAEGKICSFQRLSLEFPCKPVTPSRGQKTHTVHFVNTQAKKQALHDDVNSFDTHHLCAVPSALKSSELCIRLRDCLDGIFEPVFVSALSSQLLTLFAPHSIKTIIIENICSEFPDI
jgi:hypothetical protein